MYLELNVGKKQPRLHPQSPKNKAVASQAAKVVDGVAKLNGRRIEVVGEIVLKQMGQFAIEPGDRSFLHCR